MYSISGVHISVSLEGFFCPMHRTMGPISLVTCHLPTPKVLTHHIPTILSTPYGPPPSLQSPYPYHFVQSRMLSLTCEAYSEALIAGCYAQGCYAHSYRGALIRCASAQRCGGDKFPPSALLVSLPLDEIGMLKSVFCPILRPW